MAANDGHTKLQGSHDKGNYYTGHCLCIEIASNVTYSKYLLENFLGCHDKIPFCIRNNLFQFLLTDISL
jgi:hypothetical protein